MAVIKVINRLFSTLFTSRLAAWVRYEWLTHCRVDYVLRDKQLYDMDLDDILFRFANCQKVLNTSNDELSASLSDPRTRRRAKQNKTQTSISRNMSLN